MTFHGLRGDDLRRHLPKTLIFVVCLAYLIIIVPAPGIALPWMLVDDGLFFRWSISIARGDWLGAWDFLTTAKGPLHSLLVAAFAQAGIGPFAYKRLLMLLGSLVFVFTVIRPGRPWLRLLLLLALLADPFQFGALGLRNVREGTYLPIQMISLGLGCLALDRLQRLSASSLSILMPAAGMALAAGLLLITREGRTIVWLELLVWLALAAICFLRRSRPWRRRIFSFALAMVMVLLVPLLPVAMLRSVQASHYGYPIANSLEEGHYSSFYGTLSALRERGDSRYIPRVPVKKRALEIAIEELPDRPGGLRRILAGINWGDGSYGCSQFPETCQDMASGWLIWAVRRSVARQLGPAADEARFQKAIVQAEKELESLCRTSSRLECVPLASGYLILPQRWGFEDGPAEFRRQAGRILGKVFVPQPFPFNRPDLSRHTFKSPLPREDLERLRLEQIPPDQQLFWQRLYVAISLFGTMLRWLLLGLAVGILALALSRGLLLQAADPAAIWLFFCLLIQSGIYTLISMTSFSGAPYTILAAPIAVGLYARVVDTLSRRVLCHDSGHADHALP